MEVLERKGEEERENQVKNEEERGSRGKKPLTTAWVASPRAARGFVCPGAFIFFFPEYHGPRLNARSSRGILKILTFADFGPPPVTPGTV